MGLLCVTISFPFEITFPFGFGAVKAELLVLSHIPSDRAVSGTVIWRGVLGLMSLNDLDSAIYCSKGRLLLWKQS